MPLLTLKVDVDTYRGTREGVPNLLRILQQHQADATFLFSLGPDHTGWALRRAFRPGFFQKVSRTSVVEHYGLRTLMYGVFLPAPDIGRQCAVEMRAAGDAGFECGIHTWDHVRWQDNVRIRDAAWTDAMMQRAYMRFTDIFGAAPRTHGAAGWQMNIDALRRLDGFGFKYASDGRAQLNDDGSLADPHAGPYRVIDEARTLNCVQMPTTLPTLDELLGRTVGNTPVDSSNIARAVLRLTERPRDHIFTLHAELEGQKLAPIFKQLLAGWKSQGYTFVSLGRQYAQLQDRLLPLAPLRWGSLPGRSGELLVQPV